MGACLFSSDSRDPFSFGVAAFGDPASDFTGGFSSEGFFVSCFCSPRAGSLAFCDLVAGGAVWDFGVDVDFSTSEGGADGAPDCFGVAADDAGAAPVAAFGTVAAAGWLFF